jgi:putative transposase
VKAPYFNDGDETHNFFKFLTIDCCIINYFYDILRARTKQGVFNMSDPYTRKQGIVYKNQFHVIFCPKYRRKVLVDEIAQDLETILHEVAKEKEVTIHALEIMADHVHLFIEFDPRLLLHKVIKDMKGISSRILRDKHPSLKSRLPNLWTRSYFSCTVGHISEDTIKEYIENQKNV